MKLYGVVIMDVRGSRNMSNRLHFQDSLIKYIKKVNKQYDNILTTPITITLGDEWQAITHSPSECYEIVHEFQQFLWEDEVEAYAGIGIGELNTEIYNDIRRMDGPCFHSARNAIEIAKNQIKSRHRTIYSKNNKIYFDAPSIIPSVVSDIFNNNTELNSNENANIWRNSAAASAWIEAVATKTADYDSYLSFGEVLNTLIENNEILKSRMTLKQKRTYMDYIRHGTYRKILQEYGDDTSETISGISQKLNSAEFFTIQRNNKIIKSLLGIYCALRALKL